MIVFHPWSTESFSNTTIFEVRYPWPKKGTSPIFSIAKLYISSRKPDEDLDCLSPRLTNLKFQ